MDTPHASHCPFHANQQDAAPPQHPPGTWPPGPRSAVSGWGLLRKMSRDLLGTIEQWQREYGDLVYLRIWPEHEVIVTDPQLVRELLVQHHDALVRWERGIQVFSQIHGHSVLIAEGAPWKAKRMALQPSFVPKPVQAFIPSITQATDAALAHWQAGTAPWPIESALTSLTMNVIVRMMFSSELDDEARAAERAVHDISRAADREMYWPASWPTWVPWQREKRDAMRALHDLVGRHVAQRMQLAPSAWPDDLLSHLLHLHHESPQDWPLQAVTDECMTAFMAGHETTAATLTWWAWCMASHPEAQETARAEVLAQLGERAPEAHDLAHLPFLTQTLQETLRLYPAAPVLMTRRSTRAITLGGYQLPARTLFVVPVHRLQRDARWFPEPDAFRPERFGAQAKAIPRGAWMPFGAGPRVCLGQHLALTEMTAIAAMILQRFRLGVAAGTETPQAAMNVSLRPANPLQLRLQQLHAVG